MEKAISEERRQEAVVAYLWRIAEDSYASVAAEFNIGEASLKRWIRRLREEGTVERHKTRSTPNKRALSPAQAQAMIQWVTANPTGKLWELRQHLEQEHGAAASDTTLRSELARRGLGKRRQSKLTAVNDIVVPDDVQKVLPRLETIIADAGYQGRVEQRTQDRTRISVKIARRRGDTTTGEWAKKDRPAPTYDPGFKVVSKRWIVERSFSRTTRRRRLSRDFERTIGASKT